eukprot:TRINITY_DN944_c0_g1_i2.p1 TRINITY_DN944_c0_g1~~TRINITY_DN944_c0_g1_i2.p1  ORF type:complete len:537 (+),score=146.77 TRINITY_DN944_c0_g1_i2:163-1611(+)
MGNRSTRTPPSTATTTTSFREDSSVQEAITAALEASLVDAPLPLGWDTATTSKGVTYYVNHTTRTTTFLDPRLAQLGLTGVDSGTSTSGRGGRGSRKRKVKLPKYKDNLYAKVRRLLADLHAYQSDKGSLEIAVSRASMFEDSYEFIINLDALTLTRRLFIRFKGEEGLDYGGMSREWFLSVTKEFFSPERHLFVKHQKGYNYRINRHSETNPHHTDYFHFLGLMLGMAFYHGKLFSGHFSIPFYKMLLKQDLVLEDLKYYDEGIYSSMKKVKDADDIDSWDLSFSVTDLDEEGNIIARILHPYVEDTPVTNDNKAEFLDLVVEHYLGSVSKQVDAIRSGLNAFVPNSFLSRFTPEELEQVIGGVTPDVSDLREHTEYGEPFTESTLTIKYFWEVLAGMNAKDLKEFLKFVTGTEKVPIGGFAHLVGSNGPQMFTIVPKKSSGLPTSHSCFNRLELQTYSDKSSLKKALLTAIRETAGFGLE